MHRGTISGHYSSDGPIANPEDTLNVALGKYKQVVGIDLQQPQTLESLGLDASEAVTTVLTAIRRRTPAKTAVRHTLEVLLIALCRLTTVVSREGSLEFVPSGIIPFIALDVLLSVNVENSSSVGSRTEVLAGLLDDFGDALQIQYDVCAPGDPGLQDVSREAVQSIIFAALLDAMSWSTKFLKKTRIQRYVRGLVGPKDGKETPWLALGRLREVTSRETLHVNSVVLLALETIASKWGRSSSDAVSLSSSSSSIPRSLQRISRLSTVSSQGPPYSPRRSVREVLDDYQTTKTIVSETIASVLGTTRHITHDTISLGLPLLQFAPVPGLQIAAGTLLNIWDAFDTVEANLKACLRLVLRCAEILRSVRDEISKTPQVIDELRSPIIKLELSFQDVRSFLKTQANRTFLDRYLRRSDILRDISYCDARLSDALSAFSMSIQIRMLKLVLSNDHGDTAKNTLTSSRMSTASWKPGAHALEASAAPTWNSREDIASVIENIRLQQNLRDQTQDISYLRSAMWTALEKNSDAAMLDVLQVSPAEMPEAIVALRHALDQEVNRLRNGEQTSVQSRRHRSSTTSDSLLHDASRGAPRLKMRVLSDAADTLDRYFMTNGIESLQRLSDSSASSQIPEHWAITKYEIDFEEKIGIGSFSDVYRGSWLGQEVAIKVLSEVTPRDLFTREVEIWRTLRHPNVLELLGASSTISESPWYFVSPYFRHGSLVQYLKNLHSAELVDDLKFIQEISEGMAFLHRRGVLHGDLKAANVLIDDEIRCVVADFGQSEIRLEVYRLSGEQNSPLSGHGHGTFRWQAPELMNGTCGITAATDVYAFAMTCIEIQSRGELPWKYADDHSVRCFVLEEDQRPNLPLYGTNRAPLRRLIETAWDRNPRKRPLFASIASDITTLRRTTRSAAASQAKAPSPSMHLPWIDVTVDTISDALWYLERYPRPNPAGSDRLDISERTLNVGSTTVPRFFRVHQQRPRLFALIIGINRYKHFLEPFHNLTGCVADANSMSKYLIEALRVPPGQIVNLRDEYATRKTILQSLLNLMSDDRIGHGDPILVYFAGYGSRADAPKTWSARNASGRVSMLLPHDFAPWTSDDRNEQGISMVTLTALFAQLARAKGDNITVVLDTSFSGTQVTTDEFYPGLFVRAIALPDNYLMIPNIDREFFSRDSRSSLFGQNAERNSLLPLCLVTAASHREDAHEANGRGWFTRALLWRLRDPSISIGSISFISLLSRFPELPLQNPRCEGLHANRILFNGLVPSYQRIFTRVLLGEDSTMTLEVGATHGIASRAKFDIYASPDETSGPIGSALAIKTNTSTTSLKRLNAAGLALNCSPLLWAIQTHAGDAFDVSIAVHLDNGLLDILRCFMDLIKLSGNNSPSIQLVNPHEHHEMAITYRDGRLFLGLTDHLWRDNGRTLIDYSTPATAECAFPVLHSAAGFFYLLRHSRRSSSLTQRLRLRMYAVEKRFVPTDIGGKLSEDESVLERTEDCHTNVAGISVIPVEKQSSRYYGLRLTSSHHAPLFVWIFLFDLSNLSIHQIYCPELEAAAAPGYNGSHRRPMPSIPALGTLEVGYGSTRVGEPICFELADDQSSDVSYLKIYVTEEYVDLSSIAQESPFETDTPQLARNFPAKNVYESILLAIVQRRTISHGKHVAPERGRRRRQSRRARSQSASYGPHGLGLGP